MRKAAALYAILYLITATYPAHAQSKQEKLDTAEYSPDYCQFTASFPEEPYITRRCEEKDKDTCYDLISYTKVFDLSATINVEIICNPSTPAMYEQFTPKVMETTVRAMTRDTVIEAYDIKSREEKDYRQTGLFGKGRRGLDETLYIAQLWVAQNSIMSVQAELIGEQSDEIDERFANILRNIGFTKEIKKETPPEEEKNGEKEKKENKETPE